MNEETNVNPVEFVFLSSLIIANTEIPTKNRLLPSLIRDVSKRYTGIGLLAFFKIVTF